MNRKFIRFIETDVDNICGLSKDDLDCTLINRQNITLRLILLAKQSKNSSPEK